MKLLRNRILAVATVAIMAIYATAIPLLLRPLLPSAEK
jgi:hypothetical protein